MSEPVPVPDAPTRPHYVPDEVWLGVLISEWPISAFPDAKMAASWAAENSRRRVWKVSVPDDVSVFKDEVVPQTHVLCEVDR